MKTEKQLASELAADVREKLNEIKGLSVSAYILFGQEEANAFDSWKELLKLEDKLKEIEFPLQRLLKIQNPRVWVFSDEYYDAETGEYEEALVPKKYNDTVLENREQQLKDNHAKIDEIAKEIYKTLYGHKLPKNGFWNESIAYEKEKIWDKQSYLSLLAAIEIFGNMTGSEMIDMLEEFKEIGLPTIKI